LTDDYNKKKKRKIDEEKKDKFPKKSVDDFIEYLAENLRQIMPDLEEFFTQIQDKINNDNFNPEDLKEFNQFDFSRINLPLSPKTAAVAQSFSSSDPLIDVIDCGDNIKIIADFPGLKKEDIKLNLKKNSILISVHKKKVHKRIPLDCEVDKNSVSASYNNGILEIKLYKI